VTVDGAYEITIETPMGTQSGTLVLKTDGATLTGTSEGLTGVDPIRNGKVKGNAFEATVETKSPMGPLKVAMKCKVEGDTLTGQATTPFGPAPIKGKRISG